MSKTKFDSTIPFDLIMEVVSEVRSGAITAETAKKIAWVIGCVLEKIKPSGPPVIAAPGQVPPSDTDMDDVFSALDEIKRSLDQPMARGAEAAEFQIPSAVWALLIELIIKLLAKK